jgi:hypothetical protein
MATLENQLRREYEDFDDWDDVAKEIAREMYERAQAVPLSDGFELKADTVTRGDA